MSALREIWESDLEDEILLLRATSIQESVHQWVGLQTAFEWQLQQTAPLFEQERRAALAELQARLRRLVD